MASMHDSVRFETTVYAAIELSKKSWVVAIARPDRDRPSIHRIAGGNLADLIGRLRKAAGEKQRIVVCYEAGYDGFWLARSLAKIGIDCRVLDPASIQVNRRARRVKTDRIDSLALLRALIAIDRGERNVCAVVRVPTVEEEDARRSHRERQRLVRERTGHINRIKGYSSPKAFGGSSPNGGARELISANWPPPRAGRLPNACVVNLNGNTSVSSWSRASFALSRRSAIPPMRKIQRSSGRENCCALCKGWVAPVQRSWRARSSRDPSPAADSSAPTLG